MRRPRGYTLLELGIVIGIIVLFLGAIVASTSGFYRTARAHRTGTELNALARSAADALKRNLVVEAGPLYKFRYNTTTLALPLSNTAPLCYDLSRFPGSTHRCPTTNAPGAAWSVAGYTSVVPVPAGSPLLAALGGDKVYGQGFNAWCEPYVACVYPFRVEVLTCVPEDDVKSAGLVGAVTCGNCGVASPLTHEATKCVLVSVPTFSHSSGQLNYSYSPDVTQGRPSLPSTYADTSPSN